MKETIRQFLSRGKDTRYWHGYSHLQGSRINWRFVSNGVATTDQESGE